MKGKTDPFNYRSNRVKNLSLFLLLSIILFGCEPSSTSRVRSTQPNIIFILSDDQDAASYAFMPKARKLLSNQGMTLDNFFVTSPLCCPSRASILRGQYPHNTQILDNKPPGGGFEKFYQLGLESSTVATWLQAAGYHTMLAGKYLNGYADTGKSVFPTIYVPPNWTEWYGAFGSAHEGFNYRMNENGRVVAYGNKSEDYNVDVLAKKAVSTIESKTGRPFFLYIAPLVPHIPAVPAPRHSDLFTEVKAPRTPSFNEVDVSDKITFVNRKKPLTEKELGDIDDLYQRRLQTLQALDDLIERVVTALEDTGQLENTYIIYTSDNGYHMGEHRLRPSKNTPYEEDIRVPFVIRGPGIMPGTRLDALTLNIDLAPTFAAMAGVQPPDFVDGRSLLPQLQGKTPPTWRSSFLLQKQKSTPSQAEEEDTSATPLSFLGLRTINYTYVEWNNGEKELYDLRKDPYQLQNIASQADPTLLQEFSHHLQELSQCKAEDCRRIENKPLTP